MGDVGALKLGGEARPSREFALTIPLEAGQKGVERQRRTLSNEEERNGGDHDDILGHTVARTIGSCLIARHPVF